MPTLLLSLLACSTTTPVEDVSTDGRDDAVDPRPEDPQDPVEDSGLEDTEFTDPTELPGPTDTAPPWVPPLYDPVADPFFVPDPATHVGRLDVFISGTPDDWRQSWTAMGSFWEAADQPDPGGVIHDPGTGWDDCQVSEGPLLNPLHPLANVGSLRLLVNAGPGFTVPSYFDTYATAVPIAPRWEGWWSIDATGGELGPWTQAEVLRFPAARLEPNAPDIRGEVVPADEPLIFNWSDVDVAQVEIRLEGGGITVSCIAADDGDFIVEPDVLAWLPVDVPLAVTLSRGDHRWLDVGGGDQLEVSARVSLTGSLTLTLDD